jgi:glycosyltransferase involved in cell wall biosynthesis
VNTTLFTPPVVKPIEFCAGWVGHSQSVGEKGLDIIREACKFTGVPLLKVDAKDKPQGSPSNPQTWVRDNLYHQISVYLCASKYEGTPNPALEALACGVPIVTTRVGNMPELIQDGVNGFIVDRDSNAIADAIRKVQKLDLSTASRNSVTPSWDWKEKAVNYAKIFRELVQQGRQSTIVDSSYGVTTSL